ncbi:MAG: response regulator [Anaerolineae bacterium]|nr:response regulator [Anaerolineae bacterium]
MSNGRILVVEDDFDISNMLRIYFDSQGYDVIVAPRGGDALELCRRKLPNIVVLDIQLPDIDGYEVCRQLRNNLRTSHIPIIFLTQRDERSDKITGLELGADDYITKPFDIEELKLRVQNALRRATYESMTSPTTGLPSGKLIEEQLKSLMRKKGWTILYIGINDLEPFNEAYGFVAGNDVLRFTGLVLGEAVDEAGTTNDFIGHVGGDDFIVITESTEPERLRDKIVERFNEGVGTFYSFRDREAGYMKVTDATGQEQRVPLMTLSIGLVSDDTMFADIREITEIASEARRQAARQQTANR